METLLVLFSICVCYVPLSESLQRLNCSALDSDSVYLPSPIVRSRSQMLSKHHYQIYDNFAPILFKSVPMAISGVTFHDGLEDFSFSDKNNIPGHLGSMVNNSYSALAPVIEFFAWEETYYTLMMVDFDSPSRENPIYRPWLHWLIMNIEESNYQDGDTIVDYVGPWPEKDTGIHRYVVMTYRQPYKFNKTAYFPNDDYLLRRNFNNTIFAEKWNLTTRFDECTIDYFTAQHCSFVDKHYKHLISMRAKDKA